MGLRLDGIFTHEEWQRLHDQTKFLGCSDYVMTLRSKNPGFNVACHRADRCAWYKAGFGMVVEVEGLNPMERLP